MVHGPIPAHLVLWIDFPGTQACSFFKIFFTAALTVPWHSWVLRHRRDVHKVKKYLLSGPVKKKLPIICLKVFFTEHCWKNWQSFWELNPQSAFFGGPSFSHTEFAYSCRSCLAITGKLFKTLMPRPTHQTNDIRPSGSVSWRKKKKKSVFLKISLRWFQWENIVEDPCLKRDISLVLSFQGWMQMVHPRQ